MNKQRGFIQGAILIGIALLAVIIGALALSSRGNTADMTEEKAKLLADVTLKAGVDDFEKYQIEAANSDTVTAWTKVVDRNVAENIVLKADPGNALIYATGFDEKSCGFINSTLGITVDLTVSKADAKTVAADLWQGCAKTSDGKYTFAKSFNVDPATGASPGGSGGSSGGSGGGSGTPDDNSKPGTYTLSMGAVSIPYAGSVTVPFTMTANGGTVSVAGFNWNGYGQKTASSGCEATLSSGQTCNGTITVSDTIMLATGFANKICPFGAMRTDNGPSPTIDVACEIKPAGSLSFSGTSLGNLPFGVGGDITVTNSGSDKFIVGSVSQAGPLSIGTSTCNGVTLAPGDSCWFSVKNNAGPAGNVSMLANVFPSNGPPVAVTGSAYLQ